MLELADEIARAERARKRFESRNERLEAEQLKREHELAEQKKTAKAIGPQDIQDILKRTENKDEE